MNFGLHFVSSFGTQESGPSASGPSPVAAVALLAMLPEQLRQHASGLDLLLKLGEKWKTFNLQDLAETVDEQHAEMGLGSKTIFP